MQKSLRLLAVGGIIITLFFFNTGCFVLSPGNSHVSETGGYSFPPYPGGWAGGEGWIPPLPPGMEEKPRSLSQQEWDKVLEIARTDAIIMKQIERDNIKVMERYWVGYAGGPGNYSTSDTEFLSGKARLSPEIHWYYPAIWFTFRSRTDDKGEQPGEAALSRTVSRGGQLVGVNLDTNTVVYSSGTEQRNPPKIPK